MATEVSVGHHAPVFLVFPATLSSYLSPGHNGFFALEAALGCEHKRYSILSRHTALIHICTMLTAVCVVPGLVGKALPAVFSHCLRAPETTLCVNFLVSLLHQFI